MNSGIESLIICILTYDSLDSLSAFNAATSGALDSAYLSGLN